MSEPVSIYRPNADGELVLVKVINTQLDFEDTKREWIEKSPKAKFVLYAVDLEGGEMRLDEAASKIAANNKKRGFLVHDPNLNIIIKEELL